MPFSAKPRAAVIGSGPNGLAAAIVLARAGCPVTVFEGADCIGGGIRTAELTLPGFLHDICSAIHPMAASSPCFESFDLPAHGLEWVHSPIAAAHPFDDGSAALLYRSIADTARGLGADGAAWARVFGPGAAAWSDLRHDLLSPLIGIPRHPIQMARFGIDAVRSTRGLAESAFRGAAARALFAGTAAHSTLPLDAPFGASFGMVLTMAAHAVGWPFPRGGSQRIADALAGCLRSHGGNIFTGNRVTVLPNEKLVLGDVGPREMLALAGDRFPASYREALARYRYAPGAFKLDWALDAPIPWRAPECLQAATVHLGGTLDEIAQYERTHTGRPFVLLTQTSLFDATRAPAGKHTAWAYCHVPNGSTVDMTAAIEDQVERFAPGFRQRILARSVRGPADLERDNPNLVGGDFSGGAMTPMQLFLRPARGLYRTPLEGVFFCSASTPPGGGVHGMCGYHAARAALASVG
ncbi:MAG TPA: NAD(P)/FAD-dependent oxidoreductase [Candidatus Acidoferrum sp.]|nr:NAD(P)/FAD-dependent oxidoreductase [Candidatus Acidoferrum sp.]